MSSLSFCHSPARRSAVWTVLAAAAMASSCAQGVSVQETTGSAGTGGADTAGAGQGGMDGGGFNGDNAGTGNSTQAGMSGAQSSSVAYVILEEDITVVEHATAVPGTDFSDQCSLNQVLIGFEGTVDAPGGESYLRSISGVCATLSVSDAHTTVQTMADTTLPVRQMAAEIKEAALCPDNQIVVGFSGYSDTYVEALQLLCAPLRIADFDSNPTLSIGMPTASAQFGGVGGNAFPDELCPEGTIGVSQEVSAEDGLTRFGLGCAKPRIVTDQ